jgi:hypothetical protein
MVHSSDGAVVPDATVFLVPRQSGQPLTVQSDQTGTYRFRTGVAPGDYRVIAATDVSEVQQQDSAFVTRFAAQGVEVTLGPRDSRTLDLKISSVP